MKVSIESLKQLHGHQVNLNFVNSIVDNLYISRHAVDKMKSRKTYVDLVVENNGYIDFKATTQRIKDAVQKNILGYINTDGSINVALTDYDYFVFAYNEDKDNWSLITFKEKSWYDKTIFEKRKMAIDGFDRQYA